MVIGYANVGRFGLAHSLLAWARCKLWCDDRGFPMLSPSWFNVRIGPYLRLERDKRQYHRYFQFPGYISGLKKLYYLGFMEKVNAEEVNLPQIQNEQSICVTFNNRLALNEETHFPEIIGRNEHVKRALLSMTRPEYRPKFFNFDHVAVHIRMGDFLPMVTLDAVRSGAKNVQLPVSWYAEMLNGIRSRLGYTIPALVYSDGSNSQLEAILKLDNVTRAGAQPAVTDLLSISSANMLISSGSGFSMWGCYLGNIPRVCFPGQRLFRVLGAASSVDLEPEAESVAALTDEFFYVVQNSIQAQPRN